MSTSQNPKPVLMRRARKSIAHLPSPDMGLDKENTEHGTASTAGGTKLAGKKGRSKSLGPGGLEALTEDAGNRQKLAPVVRSILKPTIPLSPPKQIPPHPNARKSSPGKTRSGFSPAKAGSENSGNVSGPDGFLGGLTTVQPTGLENIPDPFGEARTNVPPVEELSETRVAVRTEEEQQAAAKEREKQEILQRRDARRKSLANRRVSFAPEATLHTWDVVELAEDATTSSEATNSTRRASSGSTLTATPFLPESTFHGDDQPSTPPAEVDEVQVTASPADQRNAHQKKRRRSSGIPPMNFNNPDDFSSSPEGSVVSEDTENQTFITADDIDSSDDDKDLVEREDTVTGVDENDSTVHSIASAHSTGGSSTNSSGRLEQSLRQAALQAGTQGIEFDEHGDLTMEMADDEVTNAFEPLVQQQDRTATTKQSLAVQDQENVNPFSPAFKATLGTVHPTDDEMEQEQTMDFTHAVGAILASTNAPPSPRRGRPKGSATNRKKSSGGRRRSSGASSTMADETMDLTTAIGGIHYVQTPQEGHRDESADEAEDMTMEFTSAVGGVLDNNRQIEALRRNSIDDDNLASQQLLFEENRRVSGASTINEDDMDMTVAMGGILSSITERTEPSEDDTRDMDITAAVGAILSKDLHTDDKSLAKQIMEQETDHGQLSRSPFPNISSQERVAASPMPSNKTLATSDTGSPSLVTAQSRNARRSLGARASTTPKTTSRQSTPLKKPTTPSKQLTPQPQRPSTPGKTPPSKNVAMRMSSPKRLFKGEIKKAAAPTPRGPVPKLKLNQDNITGLAAPNLVLTPVHRRMSGLGIDREGLGSPRVTALLDRRASIGEASENFSPQGKFITGVRFEDPRIMQQALENERIEDERRESGRGILQQEANNQDAEEEQDATSNLRDMIESLTPKKNKLKGRKSLHVGAARGLLGKRPVELDEDEEEDHSPKRMVGHDRSPVKAIKLPAPPPKSETTGRATNTPRFSLNITSGNASIQTPTTDNFVGTKDGATTPKNQGRFKDTELVLSAAKPPVSFSQKLAGAGAVVTEPTEEEDRIHLQDFLNMTSIRFMELTTTKRRHTIAPNNGVEDSARRTTSQGEGDGLVDNGRGLEFCVVAGACTVPMLELYQHSCRELKKYISEGRSIVLEIEADTFEENPPLFREYLSAPPEIRSIMDNQFKNVKTHARLLSKAMWYEWRMKLLDGLKDGLIRISNEMDTDANVLAQQEELLQAVLPELVEEHERLKTEAQILQAQADELASCDHEELTDARERLVILDDELEVKRKMVADLQRQLEEQELSIEEVVERKQEYLGEIKEAEKVREESRGWSVSEVTALKSSVDALEKDHGWTITSAVGPSLTLAYRSTLQLFLTPASFLMDEAQAPTAPSENSSISLTYIADTDLYHPQPLSTEKRFFLQIMRARLQCLTQHLTPIKDVLAFISSAWEQASTVSNEVEALNLTYITTPQIQSDDVLGVKASIMLNDMRTKVETLFELTVAGHGLDLSVDLKPLAKVVYGEVLKEGKMGEFLALKIGQKGTRWADAVRELEGRLVARGKKDRGE